MMNRLALFLCVILALHLGGCTSNDSRDSETAAEDSVASGDSLEDVEGLDSDPSSSGQTDTAAADTPAQSGSMTGDEGGFTDDALTDDGSTAAAPAPDAGSPAAEPTPGSGDLAFSDNPPPAADSNPSTDVSQVQETPPPSEATPAPPAENSEIFDKPKSASKPKVAAAPLQKMESIPFERDGVLLNTVYFARPGDNYSKIAKKVFSDAKKSGDLKKLNPGVKPRVGDAVYYNSPTRPTDSTVLKTYYEDAGIQPKVYQAAEGDDLKKVSKKLLGFGEAWKEVWATNSIDSKKNVPAGTELRYFAEGETAPVAAATTAPPAEGGLPPGPDMGLPPMDAGVPPPGNDLPPAAPDMNQPPQNAGQPPLPPENMLPPAGDMGMPPADAGMAANQPPPEMAPPPPPPPPPPPAAEPPPADSKQAEIAAGGQDTDLMMALGVAGVIAAALAVLMVVRKRRQQREMNAAFGDTQVGT